MKGVCVLIWPSAWGLRSASLIFVFNIFRKWFIIDFLKNSCLHPKFKLKLVHKIFEDALRTYIYIDTRRWFNIEGENNADYICFYKDKTLKGRK